MAVVPPIPKASVNTAAAVKTGDNLNCRRAYRKLPGRFCIEHLSLLYAVESRQVPKGGNRRTSPAVRRTSAECCPIDDSRSRLSRSCKREENPIRGRRKTIRATSKNAHTSSWQPHKARSFKEIRSRSVCSPGPNRPTNRPSVPTMIGTPEIISGPPHVTNPLGHRPYPQGGNLHAFTQRCFAGFRVCLVRARLYESTSGLASPLREHFGRPQAADHRLLRSAY